MYSVVPTIGSKRCKIGGGILSRERSHLVSTEGDCRRVMSRGETTCLRIVNDVHESEVEDQS